MRSLAVALLVVVAGCAEGGSSRTVAPASLAAFQLPTASEAASKAYLAALGKATGEVDADVMFAPTYGIVIERAIAKQLDQAQSSIRIAQFVFTSPTLSYAVRKAHARGVDVKVILDGALTKISLAEDDAMAKVGIPIKRISTEKSAYSRKFHHKFCVIDEAVVITGSLNWTETADMYNYENTVTIREPSIAKAFVTEFDSLWKTGKGGVATTSEVAFAPSGWAEACQDRIVASIESADTEIVAAIYLMTSDKITRAFERAIASGVHVMMLCDADEEPLYRENYLRLKKAGARIKRVHLPGSGAFAAKFHHKFIVVDGQYVVTGSFNWAPQQDRIGFDNVVALRSKKLSAEFIQHFGSIWNSKIAY